MSTRMSSTREKRRALGARAEGLVCDHLIARGFEIVGRNVRVGAKEIDIVARRGDLVVFCEVRARSSSDFGSPLETIGPRKIRNVREAALGFLIERKWRGFALRFDAAAVVFDVPEGTLDYIEGAF